MMLFKPCLWFKCYSLSPSDRHTQMSSGFLDKLFSVGKEAVPLLLEFAPRVATIASSLLCVWYKENTVIRFQIGGTNSGGQGNGGGYVTQRFTLFQATGPTNIDRMKWFITANGAPRVRNSPDYPDGRRPSLLAFAIIKQDASGPVGNLDLSTLQEQINRGTTIDYNKVPLYSNKNDVLNAWVVYLHGYDDERFRVEGGFRDSSYPGPVRMTQGDELQLVAIGSWNYLNPAQTEPGPYGHVTGTLTWDFVRGNGDRIENSPLDNQDIAHTFE